LPTALTKSPKLDARDSEAIVREARALALFYVSEWDATQETGAGATLLKIVAQLLGGIIRRLNEVPLKHFIAFLDSIKIKLSPALSARAPLTFFLSTGAKEAVVIPSGSQVAARVTGDPDPVIFETEKTILATPAKLQTITSVVPAEDEIIDHAVPLAAGATTELFSKNETNLQAHILFLAHDDLFNVKSMAHFLLTFEPPVDLTRKELSWEYCVGEKEISVAGVKQKTLDWRVFDRVTLDTKRIKLDKENEDEIKQVKIAGVNSRWIRCRVTGKLLKSHALAKLAIRVIRISTPALSTNVADAGWLDPDAAFYNDLPLTLPPKERKFFTPFGPPPTTNADGSIAGARPRPGDVFYLASQDAFSKPGSMVSIRVGAPPLDAVLLDIASVEGIGPSRAERFRAKNINTVDQLLRLSAGDIAKILEEDPLAPGSRSVREAAAKAFLDKVVTSDPVAAPAAPARSIPTLSWEYWNGNGWVGIDGIADSTEALTRVGVVTFLCPKDMTLTRVVGQENFWIRARIAFGDYGQEIVTFAQNNPGVNTVVIDSSRIRPPEIAFLKIGYEIASLKIGPEADGAGELPQYILTLNNLEYALQSLPFADRKTSFLAFPALDDDNQSLYLGFDLAPLKGPISIFFSLQEQEYTEANRPRIDWEYFRLQKGQATGQWTRLLATDGTLNLTQSGTIQFIGPPDFAPISRFGKKLFWIRALDTEKRFTAKTRLSDLGKSDFLPRPISPQLTIRNSSSSAFSNAAVVAAPKSLNPCEQASDSSSSIVKFPSSVDDTPLAPIVQGIYLNTAWAIQAETIQDELLGSSDGSANQDFTLTKAPVIEESIWIDELGTLTEAERQAFRERKDTGIRMRKDAEGNVTEFLIRWRAVDDIAEANPSERAYEIDRTAGLVLFGDGVKHGFVPPIGKDNIKATYRTGGGSRGNVAAQLIKSLRSTIPLVESVLNLEAAGGGSDTELIEKALERGPQGIKNRGRAIAMEDFEWLAKEASPAIARAKCLPTFNDKGEYKTGWVTVIIVPGGSVARPLPSPQLRQRVEKYLLDHSANVASFPLHIKVIPPVYVSVKVQADVYPLSLDLAPQVESEVIATLQAFLHPLSGGYEHTGWEFGQFPCLSDFYALLQAVKGVDHIDNLSLTLQAKTLLGESTGNPILVSEDRPLDAGAPPFTLVYSGEHKITIMRMVLQNAVAAIKTR
jgi:Baseplate J-like protein